MVSKAFKGVPPPSSSIGHWLPKDRADIQKWLATKLEQLDKNGPATLDPSIAAMQNLVAANPSLTQLSQKMFTEIPLAYANDPTGKAQVRDFTTMLGPVGIILKGGPEWFDVTDPPTAMGLIGFPINEILDWPMDTLAGYLFFLDPRPTESGKTSSTPGGTPEDIELYAILQSMGGWLCPEALRVLAAKGNDGKTDYTFQQLYVCDPTLPNFGFMSWDAFFTRKFNPGIRPIAYPDNQPTPDQPDPSRVIVNACESTPPTALVTNAKLHDIYWLKQQPYSLANMLDNDPLAGQFVGGSVYQASLSALSYHCWHAPVSGKVVGIRLVSGTYSSENLHQGFLDPDGPDPNASNNSQPYISAVATRGIIFVQADNLIIGLMEIVFVGMAEVSSCEFLVNEGDHITKGDLIGMFHFGGSSHCMVFRPSTNLQPHNFVIPPPWTDEQNNFPVCSALAVVTPPTAH